MLILAVDTSGKNGSLALMRFDDNAQRTLEVVPVEGGTFSAQLVPQIAALLEKCGLSKRDIDAFAVVAGPGSFTGLRVGLAVVKALAEVLHKPIAAVSLLEAIARLGQQTDGTAIAAMDAGRGEVYVGRFEFQGSSVQCIGERVSSLAGLMDEVDGQHIVTTDTKLEDAFIHAGVKITVIPSPRADAIARLGYEQILAGNTSDPESLDASYIRSIAAEVKKPAS
jgi:tRNA threonylcarbamoyladenosine biosynthesis protein TsaB